MDLNKITRADLPKISLISIAQKLVVSIEQLSIILHRSHRTLQRKSDTTEVFGSLEKFGQWLHPSLVFLSEQKPIDIMQC